MTEPIDLHRRCDQCAHADYLPRVHPMYCAHPCLLGNTQRASDMRAPGARCGMDAELWSPKQKALAC